MEKNEEKKKSSSIWKKALKFTVAVTTVGGTIYMVDKYGKGNVSRGIDRLFGKCIGGFKRNKPNEQLVYNNFTELDTPCGGDSNLQDLDIEVDVSSNANPVEDFSGDTKDFGQKQGYSQKPQGLRNAFLDGKKNCYHNGSGDFKKRSYASDYLGKRGF